MTIYQGAERRTTLASAMLVLFLVFLVFGSRSAAGAWTVREVNPAAGPSSGCLLETNWQTMFDGYQDTQVQVAVRAGRIDVHAKAPIDASFGDIHLAVDGGSPMVMTALSADKIATFESASAPLMEKFKSGRVLSLQLRFWPAWPQTGPRSVEFSLMGFTKAHREMVACG